MYGETDDIPPSGNTPSEVNSADEAEATPQPQSDAKLVQRIHERIRRDKHRFEKVFKRMERDMAMAMRGHDKDWSEKNYKANITGQHIKTKTANLYAKNPKIVSTRKEKLDFLVWDETRESLLMAMQTVQAGQTVLAAQLAAQAAALAPLASPALGHNGGPPLAPAPAVQPPEPVPGYSEALAVMQDFQQGMARRNMLKKFGRTLELLFADAMVEQTPLDFKAAMKRVVRRSLTTGVGYVELGFQRQYGIPSAITDQLADYRGRIAHIEKLMEEAAEGEIDDLSAEMGELQAALAALNEKPQVILRSGLTFDFLQATKVIPDRNCTAIAGFVGCRHITLVYVKPKSEIEEWFKVDLGHRYTPYTTDGDRLYGDRGVDRGDDSTEGIFGASGDGDDLVCLYKHYDKAAGVVYHLVDGHPNFVKPPGPPDVTVPRFWPVYAISFNETESESEPFPLSDVELLRDMQKEVNRSRQGKREHRDAARPRFVVAAGVLDEEEDIPQLKKAEPFDVIVLNGVNPDQDISKSLRAIEVPGVDPNLYDTNEVLMDASLTVGAQAAQLGGVAAKTTATGAAIASGTTSSNDNSSIDELDGFLTMLARDAGQVLCMNMTKDEVVRIAGPGAVWVEDLGATPEDIYSEVYLRIEAGSTGKPNQADEIRNFKDMAPILLQTGGIPPEWLAREGVRRLDDRIDLTEAIVAGVPAIVAQNRMAQPAQGDPQRDPNQQGGEGGDKNATPSKPAGSSAPIGNNQHPQL